MASSLLHKDYTYLLDMRYTSIQQNNDNHTVKTHYYVPHDCVADNYIYENTALKWILSVTIVSYMLDSQWNCEQWNNDSIDYTNTNK